MNLYYHIISQKLANDTKHEQINNNDKQSSLNQETIIKTKEILINSNSPSPRTIKREESRSDFMKYHWAWVI